MNNSLNPVDGNHNRREFMKAAGVLAAGLPMTARPASAPNQATTAGSATQVRPLLAEADVLVVGGGPAGTGAAIGAAMAGARTLLVENHSFFGGVAAWCLGMPINQMRPKGRDRSAVHALVIKKLEALGDQAVRINQHQLLCNVEYLKVALFDALDKVGCRALVQTRAVDVVMEGNRVTGVIVTTKNGLMQIRASAVVDCTGDGDVASYAGAEMMKETANLMPMTLCLNLTGATSEQVRKAEIRRLAQEAREKYPLIPHGWSLSRVGNSKACFYVNHSGTKEFGVLDATDPWQRTKAEAMSHRQAIQMTEAMRQFSDELKEIELIGTGPQLGVRETRRVKGVYVLTEEDAKIGRQFADAVAWRSGYVDMGFSGPISQMKIHDVPYRAILPQKIDGVLMAGRCISATHAAAAAGKSMGNCMATGHAAGLAAALCAKQGCLPRELNVTTLQAALRTAGVDISPADREQPAHMPN